MRQPIAMRKATIDMPKGANSQLKVSVEEKQEN